MAQRVEYQIANREGYPIETRFGHLLEVGNPVVLLALHKVSGGWAVDHFHSGRRVDPLICIDEFGRGPTLREAKEKVAQNFEKYGFQEKFDNAPEFQILNKR